MGQRIITLVDKKQEAGEYKIIWDGMDEKLNKVNSVTYFYRLKVNNFVETHKMILLQ